MYLQHTKHIKAPAIDALINQAGDTYFCDGHTCQIEHVTKDVLPLDNPPNTIDLKLTRSCKIIKKL